MDFLSQVKEVRENIAEWQKEWGDEFVYMTSVFMTEGEDIYINRKEHQDIVKYLASIGHIEIIEEKADSIRIKVLPKPKPIIRIKTLELISRDLKDYYTGVEIIALLKEAGVDPRFIVYPESKWLMFYKVFSELAISKDKDWKDRGLLLKLICDAIHPINLGGNSEATVSLLDKFNKYLIYDKAYIRFDEEEATYRIFFDLDEQEKEEIIAENNADLEYKEKQQLDFLSLPENRERISLLKKVFQSLMNVVEVFSENPSQPTEELNNTYIFLNKLVWETINALKLRDKDAIHNFNAYTSPFVNLFAAEKHYREQRKELSWQKIRPEINAMYGDIEGLYREVNGSDILAEPDKQKKLNDIQLYLSELKEKSAEAKEKSKDDATPVTKIEITKIPELKFQGPIPGKKKDKPEANEYYLDNSGDLWREPKEKYCYPMMSAKERLSMVRLLIQNPGTQYVSTQSIASTLIKEAQYVRSEIGKINKIVRERLKINADFIDGKQGSGYRINPKLKVKILSR